MAYLRGVNSWDPGEVRCEAGQVEFPAECNRHKEHHWCATCEGYYGVPHDGIHEGPDAHPNYRDAPQCACRLCANWRAAQSRSS